VITVADVEEAQQRVGPVVRPTPVDRSEPVSRVCGRSVLLKPEHLQRTGSFKVRGAYNRISRLPVGAEVVAASAGNHAQGVALAASISGMRSTIFMPATAPLPKLEATRGYGANVVLESAGVDECIAKARQHASTTGAIYVHPFDDPVVIAGQGTVGLELADEAPEAEVVVVPVGGGGLIAGVATALRGRHPSVKVVGVEAEGAASVVASLAAGHPVRLESVTTMADGIALKSPTDLTLAHVAARVDEVVTVTEEEISAALLVLLERAKAVVEPAGAAALAAVLAGKVAGSGPAAVVLSGGNIDPLLLMKVIDHGLTSAGRYLVLRVVLDDRPGELARARRCSRGARLERARHRAPPLGSAFGRARRRGGADPGDPRPGAPGGSRLIPPGSRLRGDARTLTR
jgi:threonine dehydratase